MQDQVKMGAQFHANHSQDSEDEKSVVFKIFSEFKAKLEPSPFSEKTLLAKIEQIVLQPYQIADKKSAHTILEIASYWQTQGQFQLPHIYNNDDVVGDNLLDLYKSGILTARVLKKIKEFFMRLIGRRLPENQPEYSHLQNLRQYIYDNELTFVFGRQFLQKKFAKFSHSSYSYNYSTPYSKQSCSPNAVQQLYQKCQKCKSEFVIGLLELLAKLDIIKLEGIQPKIENQFMNRLENIKRQEQRSMFVQDYSFDRLQWLKKVQNQPNESAKRQLLRLLPNYMFYKGQSFIRGQMDLKKLLNQYQDYHFLEQTHDYIQWMFPNHYGSCFNSSSSPLNYLESELFLRDDHIALAIFQSATLFFDFMGLKFNLNLQLVIQQERRLKDVILRCYHNHLRLMRILACLSVVGFRDVAIKFIEFLDQQTAKGMLTKERNQFVKSWQIYGNQKLEKAKQMCFLEKDEFPQSKVFWREIVKEIPFNKQKKSWISTEYYYQIGKSAHNYYNQSKDYSKQKQHSKQVKLIQAKTENKQTKQHVIGSLKHKNLARKKSQANQQQDLKTTKEADEKANIKAELIEKANDKSSLDEQTNEQAESKSPVTEIIEITHGNQSSIIQDF